MLASRSQSAASSLHDPSSLDGSSSLAPAPLRLGTLNMGLGLSRKLARVVARCAELGLDALALQEIGDPALLSTRLSDYQLIYSPGPSHHQAGVGLLLSLSLLPRVRRCKLSLTACMLRLREVCTDRGIFMASTVLQ